MNVEFLSVIVSREEQGWRSGESTRLPPMWPGFESWRRRHMWVEFVVGSLPCSERFFSGYSGFPLSSKTNISKLQFDQESGRRRTIMWMCYLQIVIYFFIHLEDWLWKVATRIKASDFNKGSAVYVCSYLLLFFHKLRMNKWMQRFYSLCTADAPSPFFLRWGGVCTPSTIGEKDQNDRNAIERFTSSVESKKTLTKKHNGIIKMLVGGFIAIPLFSGACFSRAKL